MRGFPLLSPIHHCYLKFHQFHHCNPQFNISIPKFHHCCPQIPSLQSSIHHCYPEFHHCYLQFTIAILIFIIAILDSIIAVPNPIIAIPNSIVAIPCTWDSSQKVAHFSTTYARLNDTSWHNQSVVCEVHVEQEICIFNLKYLQQFKLYHTQHGGSTDEGDHTGGRATPYYLYYNRRRDDFIIYDGRHIEQQQHHGWYDRGRCSGWLTTSDTTMMIPW